MMDDNQIAVLFIDYWDNHRSAESDSDESQARYILDLCSLISLRAYANREVDEEDFSEKAVTSLNVGSNMTATKMLQWGWNSLADAFGCNPYLNYKSFNEVLTWKRPVFASMSELSLEVSSKEPKDAFNFARYADFSHDLIESLAKSFYKEFVGMDSTHESWYGPSDPPDLHLRGVRFAFYGAIFSLSPKRSFDAVELANHFERNLQEANQKQITWLKNEFLRQEKEPFLSFMVDQVDPEGLKLNILSKKQENYIQRPVEVTFADPMMKGRGIAEFDPHLGPYFRDLDEYDVHPILSEDFKELEKLFVVDFLDYWWFSRQKDYPKALYLMIANPFVTLEFDLPTLDTVTFKNEWEFYGSDDVICSALPGDFQNIFHTVPRVLSFYSLQAVVERTEDTMERCSPQAWFDWDPYKSILFTRTDICEAQRTEFLTERLQNITAKDVDEGPSIDSIDGSEGYAIEIACLFEINEKMHQQIFDIGSTLLNLSLLLNPSISESLREEIGNTGLEIEFVEGFDSPYNLYSTGRDMMIERAETYKDPGLAGILRNISNASSENDYEDDD